MEYGYHRIPAVERVGDRLLAVWEGRRLAADHGDIDLLCQWYGLDGVPVTDVEVLHAVPGLSLMSPVLHAVDGGTADVYYTESRAGQDEFGAIKAGECGWQSMRRLRLGPGREVYHARVTVQGEAGWCYLALAAGRTPDGTLPAVVVSRPMPELDLSKGVRRKIQTIGDRYTAVLLGGAGDSRHVVRTYFPGSNESALTLLPDGQLGVALRSELKKRRRWFAVGDEEAVQSQLPCPGNHAGYLYHEGWEWFANTASTSKRHRLTLRRRRYGSVDWQTVRVLYEGHAGYCALAPVPGGVFCLFETDGYTRLRTALVCV